MFYSLTKLSAPVQQVLYQMKIITTAGEVAYADMRMRATATVFSVQQAALMICNTVWVHISSCDSVSSGTMCLANLGRRSFQSALPLEAASRQMS